ncbi:hypothetical protein Tco_0840601 [Tanacetum coccineum]|uniref:Uncharacterized protein n=1 Tax=Tanacetum coccineum TaxID=301880 RepID=A0ABQ5AVW4_9ASTR
MKERSEIYGGHYVTKITKSLGYYVDEELDKYSDPIESEEWKLKMFAKELDRANLRLRRPVLIQQPPRVGNEQRNEPSGLDSSWGDWNASLNEIEIRDVWRDVMLMRNGYMLEHSIPILHHLADQANYTYPTYKPPNVPPYPYPYVPYSHPYMHYPDMGNSSYGGGQHGAPRDAYMFTGAMISYGGNAIVSSSGYEIGGSSRGVQAENSDDDDMSDPFMHSEDCVESADDMDD